MGAGMRCSISSSLLAVTLIVSTTCRVDHGIEADLEHGLTFMWTTPILRIAMLPSNSDKLQTLSDNIARTFQDFNRSGECKRRGETPNDAFFAKQREAWEHRDDTFLAAFDEGASGFLRHHLWQGWLTNIEAYVSGSVGEQAAKEFFGDTTQSKLLFVWAAVHEGCSAHATHIHEDSAVSGVFYVTTPPDAGEITFEDPRGLRPPFARNRLTHQPVAGELLLFPPWLHHGVAPSCGMTDGQRRVALSFNLLTARGASVGNGANYTEGGMQATKGNGRAPSSASTDWELLADASFLMPGEDQGEPEDQ